MKLVTSDFQYFCSIVGDVSRETLERLSVYADLLKRWQNVKNLVSKSTIDDVWGRHFADSAQLYYLAPNARSWVDLGSGGGFPGLVVSILLRGSGSKTVVDLIESDHRKCAFLREVSRETDVSARVHCARIEDVISDFKGTEVVSARALASMERLIDLSWPLLEAGATGLFLKGQDVDRELTELTRSSRINFELLASKSDPHGRVVKVRCDDLSRSEGG